MGSAITWEFGGGMGILKVETQLGWQCGHWCRWQVKKFGKVLAPRTELPMAKVEGNILLSKPKGRVTIESPRKRIKLN